MTFFYLSFLLNITRKPANVVPIIVIITGQRIMKYFIILLLQPFVVFAALRQDTDHSSLPLSINVHNNRAYKTETIKVNIVPPIQAFSIGIVSVFSFFFIEVPPFMDRYRQECPNVVIGFPQECLWSPAHQG